MPPTPATARAVCQPSQPDQPAAPRLRPARPAALPAAGPAGPTRRRGDRLPALERLADLPTATWRQVIVCRYGKRATVTLAAITCLWYHVHRGRPVQVVLIREHGRRAMLAEYHRTHPAQPTGTKLTDALLTWDVTAT